MGIGDKVQTIHGKGIIIDIESYSYSGGYKRYGVELEKPPKHISQPSYYFLNDIKLI